MFQDLVDSITNVGVLTESVKAYFNNLSVSSVVITILAIFMLVGVIDKLRGNKLGYGEQFDEGFGAMGALALAVVGIIAVSPVLLMVLGPVVTPLFKLIGANPAMFSSILALDMGGYAMAQQLAGMDAAVANYSGLIVSSMMGITVCFTIPYAPTVMKKEDHPIFAMGVLVGIITLPVGCIVGGLAMNMTSTPLPFGQLMLNTLPVIALSVIVAVGLALNQKLMIKIFTGFGKVLSVIITVSLGVAIFQYLTGIRIPLLNEMVKDNAALGGVPFEIALLLVGLIAIVLAGAFPMILFLNRRLGKIMSKIGEKTGIDSKASSGLLTQLASSIPVWSVVGEMNPRGKLVNVAFAVSGSFVLGDVLGFVGANNTEMTFPVILAKFVAGFLAIFLALFLVNRKFLKLDEHIRPEQQISEK